jgi:serine/threonine protein phosphatase 1
MNPGSAAVMPPRETEIRTETGAVTDADLASEVADRHLRVDADEWDDIYLVGDVHGCPDELDRLLEEIDPSDEDLVIFVGDLIRKGPDSLAVVERVRDAENMLSVRGNNEDKLIHGRKEIPGLDPVFDYIESLPVVISFDDAMVVHGGVDTRMDLAEQDIETLLNCRAIPPENSYDGPFWFEQHDGPWTVFFGHTVMDEPVNTDHAVGLDTGCVYGGGLTAYDYYGEELISVPSFQTYQERADRKILDLPGVQEEA